MNKVSLSSILCLVLMGIAHSANLFVGDGGYSTIQSAINAASPGDVITVQTIWTAGGTGGLRAYNESIVINKNNLTIQSDGSFLQLYHTYNPTYPNTMWGTIIVDADNVNFYGPVIINSTSVGSVGIMFMSGAENCYFAEPDGSRSNYMYGNSGLSGVLDYGKNNKVHDFNIYGYSTGYYAPVDNPNTWSVVQNCNIYTTNNAFEVYTSSNWFDVIDGDISNNTTNSNFAGLGNYWLMGNTWWSGSTTDYHFRSSSNSSSFYAGNNYFNFTNIAPFEINSPAVFYDYGGNGGFGFDY